MSEATTAAASSSEKSGKSKKRYLDAILTAEKGTATVAGIALPAGMIGTRPTRDGEPAKPALAIVPPILGIPETHVAGYDCTPIMWSTGYHNPAKADFINDSVYYAFVMAIKAREYQAAEESKKLADAQPDLFIPASTGQSVAAKVSAATAVAENRVMVETVKSLYLQGSFAAMGLTLPSQIWTMIYAQVPCPANLDTEITGQA